MYDTRRSVSGVRARSCLVLAALLGCLVTSAASSATDCRRLPYEEVAPRTRLATDRFSIAISGNPDGYVPGETYTVILQSSPLMHRFTGFVLTVESADDETLTDEDEDEPQPPPRSRLHSLGPVGAGTFSLYGDSLTQFSDRCPNTITHTSAYRKDKVYVNWKAPPAGSGCVVFRATVIERPELWYMDDGPLSHILCEEVPDTFEDSLSSQTECCPCDEAKYELTFEGQWSRQTHPKGFPDDSFLAKFSDVIGASHTPDYYFWSYGARATRGLRQLAERGFTRELEHELKTHSHEIRTIIKARGLSFPEVTGRTFSVFRVDRRHHLVSIVSKISPSPDWIVGIAGLELCKNCSWVENLVLNLHPWDVGTDSGVTYTSANMPTVPQDVIRRITSSFPNDEEAPFYDESGTPLKPLARLHLTRLRQYKRHCSPQESRRMGGYEMGACATTEWSDWGPCSVTCGEGVSERRRKYVDHEVAKGNGCRKKLTTRRACTAQIPSCRSIPDDWECEVTEWSQWTEYIDKCQPGSQTSGVQYRQPQLEICNAQQNVMNIDETEVCYGAESDDCGRSAEKERDFQNEFCLLPRNAGPCRRAYFHWFFDGTECKEFRYGGCGGNQNNFPTREQCEEKCMNTTEQNNSDEMEQSLQGNGEENSVNDVSTPFPSDNDNNDNMSAEKVSQERVSCLTSEWTDWSPCSVSCGRGVKTRARYVSVLPRCRGKGCLRRRSGAERHRRNFGADCRLSEWSDWSLCSASCGPAYRQRTRSIVRRRRRGGRPCGPRLDKEPCLLPVCN